LKLNPICPDGLTTQYPFSVKPDKKIIKEDIFAIYRSHYEDTPYHTAGERCKYTAGPWLNPHRCNTENYDLGGDVGEGKDLEGAWERPICHYYIGMAYLTETRGLVNKQDKDDIKPITWATEGTPCGSMYMPIIASMGVYEGFTKSTSHNYDSEKLWWIFNDIQRSMELMYCHIHDRWVEKRNELDQITNAVIAKIKELDDDGSFANEDCRNELIRYYADLKVELQRFYSDMKVEYNQYMKSQPGNWAEQIGYGGKWITETVDEWKKGPKTYDFESKL
jgi:dipeptidase